MLTKAKALAYVTRGERLLVFWQLGRPEQGVQVPGGSVEPGESLAAAVRREVVEETGLAALGVARHLGSAIYELKVDVGPPQLRHFFHLDCEQETPERWHHVGSKTPSGEAVTFELWWEPLASARLDWEMDAYLAELLGTTHK